MRRRPPARHPGAGNRAAAHPARLLLALPAQTRALFVALFVAGLLVALMDAAIPTMIGKLIGAADHPCAGQACGPRPGRCWSAWRALMLIGRPVALLLQNLITQQGINGNVTSLIRWQSHWHVVRQGLPFFQEDFAGRIANRVMQAGPALRESVVAGHQRGLVHPGLRHRARCCCWRRPTGGWRCRSLAWFPLYALLLRYLVPRHARPLARGLGAAQPADRADRRQLHQYPDGEAVRPGAGGGRLHPRGLLAADRRLPAADAAGHASTASRWPR